LWLGLEPGRKCPASPRLAFLVHDIHEQSNNTYAKIAAIDAWITKQKEADLSRPEAIRRLVELGLKVKVK